MRTDGPGPPYLDLPLHGDAEEHDEVHYKYGPEHWHVEGFKECANHCYDNAFRRRMPGGKQKSHTHFKHNPFNTTAQSNDTARLTLNPTTTQNVDVTPMASQLSYDITHKPSPQFDDKLDLS